MSEIWDLTTEAYRLEAFLFNHEEHEGTKKIECLTQRRGGAKEITKLRALFVAWYKFCREK
jgi:hypothetical protein